MTRPEIAQSLTEVFRDVFDNAALVLTDATTAKEVERWDSLQHINLIVAAEKRFQGEVHDARGQRPRQRRQLRFANREEGGR